MLYTHAVDDSIKRAHQLKEARMQMFPTRTAPFVMFPG